MTADTLTYSWGTLAVMRRPGTGPPLLFLHGTGCASTDWTGVFAALPEEIPLLALDFRGHGRSATPTTPFTLGDLAADVLAVLDALRLPPVVLVGHSLGGMVGLEVLRRAPGLAGLVLLEGWTSLSTAGAFGEGRFYGQLPAEAIARIRENAERTRARVPAEHWAHFWSSVEAANAHDVLTHARVPIVEVYGALGRRATTQAALCVPASPWIRWAWIPEAGHYLPLECPTEVAAICAAAWECATGGNRRVGEPMEQSEKSAASDHSDLSDSVG
jgi:pimeloyl-ACP methyl ester carboxylesterase